MPHICRLAKSIYRGPGRTVKFYVVADGKLNLQVENLLGVSSSSTLCEEGSSTGGPVFTSG